jgi:hypothetical protein
MNEEDVRRGADLAIGRLHARRNDVGIVGAVGQC